mgnify:CR=1 FL=1
MCDIGKFDGSLAELRAAALAAMKPAAAEQSGTDVDGIRARANLGNAGGDILKLLAERDCLLETLKSVLAAFADMHLQCKPSMDPSAATVHYELLQDAETTVMLIQGEYLVGSGRRHYVLHVVGDVDPVLHGPYLTESIRDATAGLIALDSRDDGHYKLDINEFGQLLVSSYTGGEMDDLVARAAE